MRKKGGWAESGKGETHIYSPAPLFSHTPPKSLHSLPSPQAVSKSLRLKKVPCRSRAVRYLFSPASMYVYIHTHSTITCTHTEHGHTHVHALTKILPTPAKEHFCIFSCNCHRRPMVPYSNNKYFSLHINLLTFFL